MLSQVSSEHSIKQPLKVLTLFVIGMYNLKITVPSLRNGKDGKIRIGYSWRIGRLEPKESNMPADIFWGICRDEMEPLKLGWICRPPAQNQPIHRWREEPRLELWERHSTAHSFPRRQRYFSSHALPYLPVHPSIRIKKGFKHTVLDLCSVDA